MRKPLALLLSVSIFAAGCAHTTPNPVMFAQPGDEIRTCDGIANEMQQMINAQSVAEADRNLSAVVARPLAVTDNLNFGNPEMTEILGQIVAALLGLGEA